MIKNYKVWLRYLYEKNIRRYSNKYKAEKEELFYLTNAVPSFMRKKVEIGTGGKNLLLVSMGCYDAKTEAIYAKSLQQIGYQVYILTSYDPYVSKIFKIFGINKILYYEDFYSNISYSYLAKETRQYLKEFTKENFLNINRKGIQIGKYAASSYLRMTRKSSIDLDTKESKELLFRLLSLSIRAAIHAEQIINKIKPHLVFVIDRGYTPVGQIFDFCLHENVPVITRNSSHKSGWEILKRYVSSEQSVTHPHSLSEASWSYIKKISWNEKLWIILDNELKNIYASGDWFSEVGTQFNKIIYSKKYLLDNLCLDATKKTAVIFPHMFWDATFFYGQDIFEDYYDWYINVLKIAATNKNLNWIVKIHPANIVKAKRDHYRGEHKELTAIYDTLGKVPEHIKIIPPESDINTFSLFALMDYCLTVRGTIGIEAAAYGINTITAGTGRYDNLGFTHDFDNKEEYLRQIVNLHELTPMNKEMVELARRYAYGIFILRPIQLDLLEHGYNKDEKGSMRFKPLFATEKEFEESEFVAGFRKFVASQNEDYINFKSIL